MKMEQRNKHLIFILVIYVIYINLFTGYVSYLPTIPVYPNNEKDLDIVKKEMISRTQEDIDFFFNTNDSVVHVFLPYVNETEEELNDVATSQNRIIHFFKNVINRRRPYQIDSELEPLSTLTSQTPSYPAGHAYQSLLVASHLSKKYPHKKRLFDNIAAKCDGCRVKAGLHYKSDGEFSGKLFRAFNYKN
tara:strand:+ start:1548 stop:2117 length:570 start_codon:yes stop_codon:yes gene_type:complete